MADNCSSKSDANGSMSETESKLVLACLRNATGGTLTVDAQAVATALSMTNPKSVSNKLRGFKAKHNIPLTTSKKAADASGGAEQTIPTTPSKNRVTKNK
ncbi:hypothetical protein BJ875DRAFT_363205, partial [Amylocarpus encephaloides]